MKPTKRTPGKLIGYKRYTKEQLFFILQKASVAFGDKPKSLQQVADETQTDVRALREVLLRFPAFRKSLTKWQVGRIPVYVQNKEPA